MGAFTGAFEVRQLLLHFCDVTCLRRIQPLHVDTPKERQFLNKHSILLQSISSTMLAKYMPSKALLITLDSDAELAWQLNWKNPPQANSHIINYPHHFKADLDGWVSGVDHLIVTPTESAMSACEFLMHILVFSTWSADCWTWKLISLISLFAQHWYWEADLDYQSDLRIWG